MAGYRPSRGNNYQSHNDWNPMRRSNNFSNQNNDPYSSLHYRSNSYRPNHNHNDNHNHNHNHNGYGRNNNSSLHSVNNEQNNPYRNPYDALNDPNRNRNNNPNLPDLTQQRQPPRLLTTPQKARRNQDNDNTKGWNLNAFSFFKSAWNKIVGTPSKTNNNRHRQSMSQPPPQANQPENPYAFTPNRDNNNNVSQQQQLSSQSTIATTEPITPPTRPSFSEILQSQQREVNDAKTNNEDDNKSNNTANTANDGSTVITIHNLLQKTKLSPDDAAWLHSKIDQVTHDRYDGSLSYIGPNPRANSLIKNLQFDDSATEHSNSIFSPLRQPNKINSIPHSSIPLSRYAPHPGNYHMPSSGNNNNSNNKDNNRIRLRRKRPRNMVFNENDDVEDETFINDTQQRKRIKLGVKSSNHIRRKPFRDNYLKPMYSYQAPKYNSSLMTPQYNKRATSLDTGKHNNNNNIIKNNKNNKNKNKSNNDNDNIEHEEKKEIKQAKDDKQSPKEKASQNGFCFNNNITISANFATTDDNNDQKVAKSIKKRKNSNSYNGFGSFSNSQESSQEISENNLENKPLKKRKKPKTRSPLKDKNIANCTNSNTNTSNNNNKNDEDDDDDDLKKKKDNKDDSISPLKKNNDSSKSPSPKHSKSKSKSKTKTKKRSPTKKIHETPVSKALNIANKMISNPSIKPIIEKNKNMNKLSHIKTSDDNKKKKQKIGPIINKIKKTPPTNKSPSNKSPSNKSPTNESNNNDVNNNKKKKEEKKEKDGGVVGESYLMKVMRERKKRYLKGYKMRLERIYKEHQPSKLTKVDEFIKKYGHDAEKLHDLYKKVCKKYELQPLDLYEGQEHEKEPNENDKEKLIKDVIPQMDNNGFGEKKNDNSFKFSLNSTSNDNNDDTGKKKEKPITESSWGWGNSNSNSNGFGQTEKKKETEKDKEKEKEKEKPATTGWNFGTTNFSATTNKTENDDNKSTKQTFENSQNPFDKTASTTNGDKPKDSSLTGGWTMDTAKTTTGTAVDSSFFEKSATQFSLPTNFTTKEEEKPSNDNNNNDNNKNNQNGTRKLSQMSLPSTNSSFNSNGFDANNNNKSVFSTNNNTTFSTTNSGFKFGSSDTTNKPSLNPAPTEIINDNNNTDNTLKNNASNGWSFGGNNNNKNNNSNNDNNWSWDKSKTNNNNDNKKNENSTGWSFGGNNNTKPTTTNDFTSSNSAFGSTTNNMSPFSWQKTDKKTSNGSGNTGFSSSFTTNNNKSQFNMNTNTNTNNSGNNGGWQYGGSSDDPQQKQQQTQNSFNNNNTPWAFNGGLNNNDNNNNNNNQQNGFKFSGGSNDINADGFFGNQKPKPKRKIYRAARKNKGRR